jgi:hypothetical protein
VNNPAFTGDFCHDDELGYLRSRTNFVIGESLVLDEAYRLAHLPLVAPAHPSVISARDGTSYSRGRHDRMFSLVLPIPVQPLERSEAYQELDNELRQSPLASIISWKLLN